MKIEFENVRSLRIDRENSPRFRCTKGLQSARFRRPTDCSADYTATLQTMRRRCWRESHRCLSEPRARPATRGESVAPEEVSSKTNFAVQTETQEKRKGGHA